MPKPTPRDGSEPAKVIDLPERTETQEPIEELLQRAYRYALSLTGDRGSAEDLVGDACLALSRRGGPWG